MPQLTTHVLDTTRGAPAAGVAVTLADALGVVLASAVTDADGRAGLGPDRLVDGDYALRFATREFFAARGTQTFFPLITVEFTIADDRHHHVPILMSPFAYSTYRGS